jgi:diamine N-acetyltransferase
MTTTEPLIRRATPEDAATMAELGRTTFIESFGHSYPPEDLQAYLAESHTLESWTSALTDVRRAIFLAEHPDGRSVGFICVGPCKLPVKDLETTAGEIQQLYVLSEFHDLRVGTQLMRLGVDWLVAQGRSPLYVGVWSQNRGAQRFYRRHGFDEVGQYGFPVGKTVDRELILKRRAI